MITQRFLKAAQLIATVNLSKIEESIRQATRVPREAAGEAAVQIGDAGTLAGRKVVEVAGSSLRAIGRTVSQVSGANDDPEGD